MRTARIKTLLTLTRLIRIAACTLASVAVAHAVAADPASVQRSLTRTQVDSAGGAPIRLECPAGTTSSSKVASFNYPAGTPNGSRDGPFDVLSAAIDAGAGTGASFAFRVPASGHWDSVLLFATCYPPEMSSSPVNKASASFNAPPTAGTVRGTAQCSGGQSAIGGSANFPDAGGAVLEETANVGGNDPFQLAPINSAPTLWDAFGICLGVTCQLDVIAVCATPPAANLIVGKRLDADGTDTGALQAVARVARKLAIAPDSAGTVAVSCPAGTWSSAGGYVSANSGDVTLLDLQPTSGTPYKGRPDGIQEAPSGWSATMLNRGATTNEIGVSAVCIPAPAPTRVTVFEFYNTTLNHYFRTAESAEAVAIDGGAAGPGWQRTGFNFAAYKRNTGPGNDVCRFYNPVANTHFYTAEPNECAQVKLDPGWHYEENSFRIQVPVPGNCPQGTVPVYRNYNNRFAFNDSNHRFTTDIGVYNAMIAAGWLPEGIVMCALP